MFGLMTVAAHKRAMAEAPSDSVENSRRILLNTPSTNCVAIGYGMTEHDYFVSTLHEIAAMETPSCANIGKKMAARAREVLSAVE